VCLIELIAARHDYQDVDVAIGVWLAVSMRAEQNDLVRVKELCNLAGILAYRRRSHIGCGLPRRSSFTQMGWLLGAHRTYSTLL
jgi:hypothetical protein